MKKDNISALKKAEDNLLFYEEIISNSPSMIAVIKGKDMIVELANKTIIENWGKGKDVIGKSIFEILPEIVEQGYVEILSEVFITGQTYEAYEVPVKLIRNGDLKTFYYTFTYQAQRSPLGLIDGIVIIANEVSPQVVVKNLKQENEQHFRLIAEMISEKVCIASPLGKVFFYNQSWLKYSGKTLKELILNDWFSLVHPEDLNDTKANWQKAVDTGENLSLELRIRDKNAAYRWHSSKVNALHDEKGNIKLWINFITDIEDQKQIKTDLEKANSELKFQKVEKSKRAVELGIANLELAFQNTEKEKRQAELLIANYSRILIEASKDPLITLNNEGKITDMNEALTHITGKTRKELINTDFKNYFTDPEKAHEVYSQVFSKGFVKDYPLTMKDHVLTDVLFNGSVYKDESGNVKGVVIVARDVTDQKKIKKELIDAKLFAEQALLKAQLATELAENAAKSKQQFLSNMSHEIRTPMNAIIGFTKVILKTELTAKQKEYLTAIKLSGDALIVLINDILDLAKVDSGKMNFESIPFKMNVSILAMLHLFETKIQEKNLELITTYDSRIPEVLEGDPVRLHQIILNLVSNALKFTSDGKIMVSVNLLEEDDEKVKIEFAVKDTGIGIAENKKERIFDNFQQASSDTSRLYGGTGLGLAIVKQLVESQGGTIKVESTLAVGSTFSFVLGFKKTNAEADELVEFIPLDRELKNISVLVVEDMPLNQLLMKTLLDDFGFERDVAENGKIAIEKLKNKIYDVVLMDLQMPEMNGFEATKHIRKVLKSNVPIIALTADVTTVDLEKCKAVGMNDYIAKPVDERLLYTKIVGLVKKMTPILAINKKKYTDLSFLIKRTKADPTLMMEMISLYLEQTPPLVLIMKQSLKDKDWKVLGSAIHKMIPSFSIVGIHTDFEKIAKKVQEFAVSQQVVNEVDDWVFQLEMACDHACEELKEDFCRIEKLNTKKN